MPQHSLPSLLALPAHGALKQQAIAGLVFLYCLAASLTVIPWRRTRRESQATKEFNNYWHARVLLLLVGGLWVVSAFRQSARSAVEALLICTEWLAAHPDLATGFSLDTHISHPQTQTKHHQLVKTGATMSAVLDVVLRILPALLFAAVPNALSRISQASSFL